MYSNKSESYLTSKNQIITNMESKIAMNSFMFSGTNRDRLIADVGENTKMKYAK